VNAYQILGISPRSTPSEIKAAYRRAATTNHPDRGGSHEMMVIINQAYEQVKSRPNTRRNTTRKPTSPAPTPINLSDWFSLYNQLLLIVKHRCRNQKKLYVNLKSLHSKYFSLNVSFCTVAHFTPDPVALP
jgi:DnaJ domain